jgi:hypothetical protein
MFLSILFFLPNYRIIEIKDLNSLKDFFMIYMKYSYHTNTKISVHIPYRILLILFLILNFSVSIYSQDTESSIITLPLPDQKNTIYQEQISCSEKKCHKLELNFNNSKEVQDKVFELMGKQAGKILVEVTENPSTIESQENEVWKKYLREISQRKGLVVFEPYYINTRDLSLTDLPVYGDYFRLASTIYGRLNSLLVYGRMENYNAKVLFHPITHEILLFYFVHKDYGGLCNTVHSNCANIEYLDDEIFDLQMQEVLLIEKRKEFTVQFNNKEATLPAFHIELEALLDINSSARLYKWLVASKESEAKPIQQDRFITLEAAIKVIDYSITVYDTIQKIRMYSNARTWKATAYYQETEKGKIIQSVHFQKISSPK